MCAEVSLFDLLNDEQKEALFNSFRACFEEIVATLKPLVDVVERIAHSLADYFEAQSKKQHFQIIKRIPVTYAYTPVRKQLHPMIRRTC